MSIRELTSPSHEDAIEALRTDGVFRVSSYLDAGTLLALRGEFERAFQGEQPGVRFIDYSLGRGAVCQPAKLDVASYPAVRGVFLAETFHRIAAAHLHAPFELNRDVFMVEDVVGSRHCANDLHYDVLHTLKFFVYLNDVSVENGAFACVPGSHRETVLLRKQHGNAVTLDNRRITRELPVAKFAAPEPVEGNAGTLIVFDTDVWHRAGTVSSGHRLVMRGHTRTVGTVGAPQSQASPAPPNGFRSRFLRWLSERRG